MQIPLLYHIFNQYKQENFSSPENDRKIPLSIILYYLLIIYLSTLVSVYATVLAWEKAQGSLMTRLNYALLGHVTGVFYLIYHYFTYRNFNI